MSIVCEHGSLKRSCEICERDAEIDRLRADKRELVEQLKGLSPWCRGKDNALVSIEKHKEGMWKK